jgi:hypothetical protein
MNYIALGCIATFDDAFSIAYPELMKHYVENAVYPIRNFRKNKIQIFENDAIALDKKL